MSVQINKEITTVQVEVPKTNLAIENAITQVNVQLAQPSITISQAGVSGKDGTSGTSGTNGGSVATNSNSQPASPVSGALYFNTTDFHFYGWNGEQWKQLDN